MTQTRTRTVAKVGDRYLIFRAGQQEYALPAGRVSEIRTLPPRPPAEREGATGAESIALHGQAVPVVDLARRFRQTPKRRRGRRVVIVLPVDAAGSQRGLLIGLLVDTVSNVVPISPDRMSPAGTGIFPSCKGRVRINGRFKYILDPDLLLESLSS